MATIVIVLAFSLLYDVPDPAPPTEPTPGVNCIDYPMQRGLGWEPWVLVEECE